jgi:hypothetical protein
MCEFKKGLTEAEKAKWADVLRSAREEEEKRSQQDCLNCRYQPAWLPHCRPEIYASHEDNTVQIGMCRCDMGFDYNYYLNAVVPYRLAIMYFASKKHPECYKLWSVSERPGPEGHRHGSKCSIGNCLLWEAL